MKTSVYKSFANRLRTRARSRSDGMPVHDVMGCWSVGVSVLRLPSDADAEMYRTALTKMLGWSVPRERVAEGDCWMASFKLRTPGSTEGDWTDLGRIVAAFGAPQDPIAPIAEVPPHATIYFVWTEPLS